MKEVEKRKNEITSKLRTLCSCGELKPHEQEWIVQTIEFIREIANE